MAIYGPYTIFTYLLTYLLTTSVSGRVPVVLPGGYPGNKLPRYGQVTRRDDKHRQTQRIG